MVMYKKVLPENNLWKVIDSVNIWGRRMLNESEKVTERRF